MSTRYIYPKQKFKISIELEVDVKFIGIWDGISKEVFEKHYQEMLLDGSFVKLLKDKILKDLGGEAFIVTTQNHLIVYILKLKGCEMKFQGNDIVLEHGSVLIYTYPAIGDKIDVVVQWYAQFCYQDNERYEELLYLSEWCNSLEEAMNWYNSKVEKYVV